MDRFCSQSQRTKQQAPHIYTRMVCLLLLVTASTAFAENEPYWSPAGSGMQGVGAISKTWPTQTSDLHWSGGSGPEYASFQITISNPVDCDTYHWYDTWEEEWKSTVSNRPYSWLYEWIASAGSITTSGWYTPPDATNNHVTIECFVHDCSAEWNSGAVDKDYYDDGDDSAVHREWGGALRIFKVGVYMSANNCYFWEDSGDSYKNFVLKSDLSDLECSKVSTIEGITDVYASSTGWDITRTWTTVTQPAGCDIMGGITFDPFIWADGLLEVYYMGYCTAPWWGSSIAAVVEGVAGTFPLGPYEPAASAITNVFGSGNCDVVASVAIQSVIQFTDESGGKITSGPWSGFSGLVFDQSINACCLNAVGTCCYKVGQTTEGTISATSKVAVNDDNPFQWGYGKVDELASEDNFLAYGSWRPTYSFTYPHEE